MILGQDMVHARALQRMIRPQQQQQQQQPAACGDGKAVSRGTGAAPAAPSVPAGRDLELLAHALRARLARATGRTAVADSTTATAMTAGGDGVDAACDRPREIAECLLDLDRLHAQIFEQASRGQRRIAELQSALAAAQAGERQARRLALHDPLTKLPNRDVFLARLADTLARCDETRPVAVLYLDLDGFKAINDCHGHAAGDAVLQVVAARLAAAVRAGDLVCRIGGDEFTCVLDGVPDREHLSHLACKLLDTVSAPLQIGALRLEVQPSIGIAYWPDGGTTLGALVANADIAMYRAKQKKCGYAFFDETADRTQK